MRVGILTPTQASDTPYSSANRYVPLTVANRLVRRGSVLILQTDNKGRVLLVQQLVRKLPSSVELVHARLLKDRIKTDSLPPANPNLDLAYPEAMRASVHAKHPAFDRACREARQRKAEAKRLHKLKMAADGTSET